MKQMNFNIKHGSIDARDVTTRVIIHAQMKTGSTFLGQILNRNSDILYIFEPLHAITNCLIPIGAELTDYENNTSKCFKEFFDVNFQSSLLHV